MFNRTKRIYLAGPYTHINPRMMERRYRILTQITTNLVSLGYLVFSPITHSHPINLRLNIFEFAHWRIYDLVMIAEWTDEIWVAPIRGWEDSIGVKGELEFAKKIGIDVRIIPMLLDPFDKWNISTLGKPIIEVKELPDYYDFM